MSEITNFKDLRNKRNDIHPKETVAQVEKETNDASWKKAEKKYKNNLRFESG